MILRDKIRLCDMRITFIDPGAEIMKSLWN